MVSLPVSFSAPVGGERVPFPSDFAPAVLFAILFAALFLLIVYRLVDKRSRNTLLISSALFAIERVVIFSLRAVQAHNAAKRLSKGLNAYMQWSFALGFVSMAQDLVSLTRCVLANATRGSTGVRAHRLQATEHEYPSSPENPLAIPTGSVRMAEGASSDLPRARFWIRRLNGFVILALLGAVVVTGTIAGSQYGVGLDQQSTADNVYNLRFASCGVVLFLTVLLALATVLGRLYLRRIDHQAVYHLVVLAVLISIVAIYRLAVMSRRVTSLTAPNAWNTPGAKAAFDIFHIVPEWLAALMLFGLNVREDFQTGTFGDYRSWDGPAEKKALPHRG